MRKPIILLMLLCYSLISCEKQSKRCWSCETEITYRTSGFVDKYESLKYSVCDMDDDDIRLYEAAKTFDININLGSGKTASHIQRTKCK